MIDAEKAGEPAGFISQELEWLAHWYARKWQGKRGVQVIPRDRLNFQNVILIPDAEPPEPFNEKIKGYFSLAMILSLENFSEITHFTRPVYLLRSLERETRPDSGVIIMHQITLEPPSNVKNQ